MIKFAVIIAIVTVATYVAASFALQNFLPQSTPLTPEESKNAPLFTVEDINGTKVSLSDFKGKIIVLYFLGTVHDEQLLEIEELWPRYGGENVVVIGLVSPTCDCMKDLIYQVREGRDIKWFLARDDAYTVHTLYAKYIISHGEPYLPTIILIDKNLDVHGSYGFIPASTLSEEIEGLITR